MSFSLCRPHKSKLYCFTPEVMLLTFIAETVFGIYTLIRYRMTSFGRTSAAILFLLAAFQISEYQICAGVDAFIWSRVGFVAITLLPVVGLYLVSLVTHQTKFLKLGYAIVAVYALYFAFIPHAITGAFCGGNYVIFHGPETLFFLFAIYYFGFLLLGIWEAFERIKEDRVRGYIRTVLTWLIIGYISFMLPMAIVYALLPGTRSAIVSIMCGFAVLLAIILTFKVVPDFHKGKK